MRFSTIALLAFTGSALAQGGSDGMKGGSDGMKGGSDGMMGGSDGMKGGSVSPDSDGCFENCFRKSGCAAGDSACFCNNQLAVDKSACCVSKECSPEAQKIVGILAHLSCLKGTAKVPPRQADGCKKLEGAKMVG